MGENPYGELICQYFQTTFPKIVQQTKSSLLEIISLMLFGTKENRYGPIPSPENQVVVRNVIKTAIERNEPIPILVPWGSRKAVAAASIDIAEVSALNQLISLDNAIKEFYPSGLRINIRIEDIGGYWLFREEGTGSITNNDSVLSYSEDLTTLIHILRGDSLIDPVWESTLMNGPEYFRCVDNYSVLIDGYLRYSEDNQNLGIGPAFESLNELGWKGEIPLEQRDYYYSTYEKLYPNANHIQNRKRLADYLGGAMVRYKLNGRGEPKTDYGHIQLTFIQPIPGTPTSINSNILYWRSVPMSQSRTNISPWRAKGYLHISGNDVKTKITNWGNTELIDQLQSGSVSISDDLRSVKVKVDYLIEN